MSKWRVLLTALIASALVAAGCSNKSSTPDQPQQESQSGSANISDVLEGLKTEIDGNAFTTLMQNIFPNLAPPSGTTDAFGKLTNELADSAKTDPTKAACTGVSVLEDIVSSVTEAATQLSSDAQAVVTESLKPIKDGLREFTDQKQYKSDCAKSGSDSALPNQSALIAQLLEPIIGGWSPMTLICDVVLSLAQTIGTIAIIAFLLVFLFAATVVLVPLAIALFYFVAIPGLLATFGLHAIYNALGCPPNNNAKESKIPEFNSEEVLRLAQKAMPQ